MKTAAVILVFITAQLAAGHRSAATASPTASPDLSGEAPRCCCCMAGACACGCSAPTETQTPESPEAPKPAPARYCGCDRAPLSPPPESPRIVVERTPAPASADIAVHRPVQDQFCDRRELTQTQAHGPPAALEALQSIILLN